MIDDMKVSKGLVFPVVALPGVGHMPARAKTSRRPRGCFMWRRQGLRKGWFYPKVVQVGLLGVLPTELQQQLLCLNEKQQVNIKDE